MLEEKYSILLQQVRLEPFTPSSLTSNALLREAIELAREQGYAVVDPELDLGLKLVAVPAFAEGGELLGALTISTNAAKASMNTLLQVYLPELQAVAEKVRQAAR